MSFLFDNADDCPAIEVTETEVSPAVIARLFPTTE